MPIFRIVVIYLTAQIVTVIKKWFSRSTNIDIKVLSKVEQQIITEIDPEVTVFESFGYGSFLKFITNEAEIFDLLKFAMSSSSSMFGSNVTKDEFISFLKQCQEENKVYHIIFVNLFISFVDFVVFLFVLQRCNNIVINSKRRFKLRPICVIVNNIYALHV